MTLPCSRLIQCATVLLALLGARVSFSQSVVASSVESHFLLPDAPSYSTSQQPSSATKEPAKPDVHADQGTDPCKIVSAALPNETDEQHQARDRRLEADCEVKAEEKQRFGGVMPQFNVVMSGHAVPLTPKQKFDISLHTVIDPYTVALAVLVGGGIGELTDSHTGYGHGPAGLFKRIGASYADAVDGNLIGNALLPVILHQDPRYFRKGEGPIKSRIIYSAMTTFICHSDSGKLQFNTSNVAGNFIAGAISNAYYPADERGVGLTLENGLVVTLEGMLGAQILEFSPDITNKIKRHNQRKRDAKAAAALQSATPTMNVVQPAAPKP